MQITVLIISLFAMAIIAGFFISAIRASNNGDEMTSPDSKRSKLIWAMIIGGLIITPASLWKYPHAISESADVITINASGAQWYWEIDTEEVALNQTAVFNVHTVDVSHGLGVMDPDGRIIFQAQAMPGYVNKVEHTFTKPGLYRVVCMEYCGVAHHDMITEFEVSAKQETN